MILVRFIESLRAHYFFATSYGMHLFIYICMITTSTYCYRTSGGLTAEYPTTQKLLLKQKLHVHGYMTAVIP